MGLFDKIKGFIERQYTLSQKDDVLFSTVHYILTQEMGWTSKRFRMAGDEHEAECFNPSSPIKRIEIESKRIGDRFYLEFEAESLKGELAEGLIESLTGFEVDFDKKLKVYWDLDYFVDDNLVLRNEEELEQNVKSLINKLERRVARG